ncbi:MAG: hypothetical protein RL226_1711 [Bacteroidota bacterium]|jgi:hypothetical protein
MDIMMRILLLLLFVFPLSMHAQRKFEQSTEFGIFGGTAYYIGDINPYKHFNGNLHLAAGVMYRQNLTRRWSVKGTFSYGNIEASDAQSGDAWRQNRNLSFRNEIIEGAVTVELNYFNYQIGNPKFPISPYLFLGLGYYKHKPMANYQGKWYELQPLGTEGQGTTEGGNFYALNGISWPFGAGLKMNLFSIVGLSFEWGMRKTYTDYLDDVSTKYVSQAVLSEENGMLSALLADRSLTPVAGRPSNEGMARGDSGRRDWFNFSTVTLSIRLGKAPTTCWNQ